jgi:hypothetical protein
VRGVARHLDSELVGRDAELSDLVHAFDQVRDERACRLVTVSGEAGIGKTRLADEFVRRLRPDARVLIGRCLSFGEGITYWPIAEAVRAEAGIADGAETNDARGRPLRALEAQAIAAEVDDRSGERPGRLPRVIVAASGRSFANPRKYSSDPNNRGCRT